MSTTIGVDEAGSVADGGDATVFAQIAVVETEQGVSGRSDGLSAAKQRLTKNRGIPTRNKCIEGLL